MERVNIKMVRSQAKIIGTIVCFGGAMLMTLYKGPIVHMFWSPHHQSHIDNKTDASVTSAAAVTDKKEWIIGFVLIVAATLAWSALFIVQVAVLKKYSAQLSLATLMCFMGTIQATVLSVALVRDPSQWAIGWDIKLLTAVYSDTNTGRAYEAEGVHFEVVAGIMMKRAGILKRRAGILKQGAGKKRERAGITKQRAAIN